VDANQTVEKIKELGLVVVVRAPKADDSLMKAIEAVCDGGVGAVEITFTVPDAVSVIGRVKEAFGDRVVLGAGTVVNPTDAVAAVNAGAKYVISPGTNANVISISKALGAAAIPGAFTPTEVMGAWSAGADLIKVFPASLGGPALVKALRGPFPHIPFVPTGGVDVVNIPEFIKVGSVAVAVGSNLFDKKMVAAGDYAGLKGRASAFVEAVKRGRDAC
jgi:2-dehydro-3-deoxyphosphogluconate aldolase/(4S)-4-hydroxy-2-oxoglutarate aldolase